MVVVLSSTKHLLKLFRIQSPSRSVVTIYRRYFAACTGPISESRFITSSNLYTCSISYMILYFLIPAYLNNTLGHHSYFKIIYVSTLFLWHQPYSHQLILDSVCRTLLRLQLYLSAYTFFYDQQRILNNYYQLCFFVLSQEGLGFTTAVFSHSLYYT